MAYQFGDLVTLSMVREPGPSTVVSSADKAFEVFRSLGMEKACEEYFNMVCLDQKGAITGIHEVSHGDLAMCIVHPREVFKRALVNNAASIIVAHNHPSGDVKPSAEDITLTMKLKEAGELLGIPVRDHLIIGDCTYYSFKDEGML